LPTAAQKTEFRRALKQARIRQRLSQRALGQAAGVSKTAVSQWELGRSVPVPAKVPNVERALELEPGALSRLLGYLPIATADDENSQDVVAALRGDKRLDEEARKLMIGLYRRLVRPRPPAPSP